MQSLRADVLSSKAQFCKIIDDTGALLVQYITSMNLVKATGMEKLNATI